MSYRVVAKKLIDSLYSSIDNKEYYDVILYGLEITLSTLVNMILVVTLAFALRIPLETLTFCLFFMPLRVYAGGAHAKSHSACIGLFLLCALGSIYFSKQVSDIMLQYLLIFVLLVVSTAICIAYAGKGKKAGEAIRRRHRRLSLVIVLIDLILITLGAILNDSLLQYLLIAGLAVFCQSMALLPIWSRTNSVDGSERKGETNYEKNASETYF